MPIAHYPTLAALYTSAAKGPRCYCVASCLFGLPCEQVLRNCVGCACYQSRGLLATACLASAPSPARRRSALILSTFGCAISYRLPAGTRLAHVVLQSVCGNCNTSPSGSKSRPRSHAIHKFTTIVHSHRHTRHAQHYRDGEMGDDGIPVHGDHFTSW